MSDDNEPVARTSAPRSVVVASRIFMPEPAAASLRLAALVRVLSRAGHEVRVLTTRSPSEQGYVEPAGVRVRRWPVIRDSDGYVRGYIQYLSFDVPLVVRLLLTRRPDVVVVEPPPTSGAAVALVCTLKRVPYVYYAADVWSEAVRQSGVPSLVQRTLRRVERSVMRRASAVLATSPGVADRLNALGVTEHVTVGNGVDVETFSPGGPRADDGRPYLLYAGTASEWQGAEIFTRAMARVLERLPDARLVFLGQGSDVERMKEQAARLPAGAVEFHDRVPPDVAARWIRGARAALASVRPGNYEFALPTKVYAAAACGTPVVFAGAGPATELIRSAGLGSAVEYDVDAVAEALVAALEREPSPEEGARLAAWAADNVSIDAAARRALDEILRVARRQ